MVGEAAVVHARGSSTYTLVVGGAVAGEDITFTVAEYQARETAVFSPGERTQLNLHATTPARMYWTDWTAVKIQRAALDGSQVENLVTELLGPHNGYHTNEIALDTVAGKMYWTLWEPDDPETGSPGTSKIQRSNLNGSQKEDLVAGLPGVRRPNGLALDVTAGKLYWTSAHALTEDGGGAIQRSNLDGSGIEDLVTSGLRAPGGLALDIAAGKMYWADYRARKIQRANLDGSQVEDLVSTGATTTSTPLALDVAAGKMYWTLWDGSNPGRAKIQRANLDGSQVEDLVTGRQGLKQPGGIALDPAAGKMYWADTGSEKIQRANLDGSQVEDLIAMGLDGPRGIALDLSGSVASRQPPPASTIVFSDDTWPSARLQNHIARYIVENGYGHPTDAVSVTGTVQAPIRALRNNVVHVKMEIWLNPERTEVISAWEEALESGEVFSPGASLGRDWRSAFVIPAYLQAQHPGLDSVEDLKEQRYKDLFKTAETGAKGRLVSCPVGWSCALDNAAQVEGYGLSGHIEIVNPGSAEELDADLHGAYERREPWLGYQWNTSDPALLLDLVRLEEPEYSDACWQTTKACAYADSTVLIGVNSGLTDLAPGVVEFLRKWDFSIDVHLRSVIRWLDSNPEASHEDAALYWLSSNVDVWRGWVTEEAATGILAALPAAATSPSVYVTGGADTLVRLNSPISLTATFSRPVSGFAVDDITVVNGTAGNFAGSGAVYTFDVTPNDIGQVTVAIAADMAVDADGNGNTAAVQLQLGVPYDDNSNGVIERSEVIRAINDYLGEGAWHGAT